MPKSLNDENSPKFPLALLILLSAVTLIVGLCLGFRLKREVISNILPSGSKFY